MNWKDYLSRIAVPDPKCFIVSTWNQTCAITEEHSMLERGSVACEDYRICKKKSKIYSLQKNDELAHFID